MATIEVHGRGWFPWDMLRYDGAYPAGPRDSAILDDISKRLVSPEELEKNPLRLICSKAPTPARWSSFGWVCREVP